MFAHGVANLLLTVVALAVEARRFQAQASLKESANPLASLLLARAFIRSAKRRQRWHLPIRMVERGTYEEEGDYLHGLGDPSEWKWQHPYGESLYDGTVPTSKGRPWIREGESFDWNKTVGWNKPNPVAVCKTTMGTFKLELYIDKMPLTVSNFIDLAQNKFYDNLFIHRVLPGFIVQFGCPRATRRDGGDWGLVGCGSAPPDTSFTNLVDGTTHWRNYRGCIIDEHFYQKWRTDWSMREQRYQVPYDHAPYLSNELGTLSLCNCNEPDTGGSQVFINMGTDNGIYDYWNTSTYHFNLVFGKVIENFDVLKNISKVKRRDVRPIRTFAGRGVSRYTAHLLEGLEDRFIPQISAGQGRPLEPIFIESIRIEGV